MTLTKLATALALAGCALTAAAADWKPTRPVEFIVTAGPGGGTDQFARVVQSVVQLLESDILNPTGRFHRLTTVLDKIAAGELISTRLLSPVEVQGLLVPDMNSKEVKAATP